MASVTSQPTPNPHAYKFTIEGHAFDSPTSVASAADAAGTPFEALFRVEGVASVFATANFVTVMKDPGRNWGGLIEPITAALEGAF
jgi:hypothetical protein